MHRKADRVFRKILHWLEGIISTLTLIVMVGMLCLEVYHMITVEGYFDDLHRYLHNILTIVVGLEFVRMLIDLTPANTIEVLIVAISRQVIVTHDDPVSNVCCVICIAGLFATRHFLIPKNEMAVEMSEVVPDEVPEKTETPQA